MSDRPRKPRVRLRVASALLTVLAIALFVTSTPQESPARTWSTWAWEARYRALPVEDPVRLAEMHRDAAGRSREECVACHGDKTDSDLLVHRIHLMSDLLPRLACHECHQRVDIESRGSTNAVTLVDVGFCKKCHSAFPGGGPESHMHADDIESDCTMCHSGARAIRHAQPYLSQVIPASECKGCHGGRVLPWTPRHERADWLLEHGMEALAVGTEGCFECHDFGLKFCDECHERKPPSHANEDRWLHDHVEKAQVDTRACFTCHDPNDCKTCHVNHEADWRARHHEFVRANGDESCAECHSASFCSYCHTAP